MMKIPATTPIALVLLALVAACREPLPCPDCQDHADGDSDDEQPVEDDDDQEPPDLPCGGADLMTDNHNCGTCKNECPLWFEGTQWEAGTCEQGECGPGWKGCRTKPFGPTCEDICGDTSQSCVARGCSGHTALLIAVDFSGTCGLSYLHGTMEGACDDPIPWSSTSEWNLNVMCCCE